MVTALLPVALLIPTTLHGYTSFRLPLTHTSQNASPASMMAICEWQHRACGLENVKFPANRLCWPLHAFIACTNKVCCGSRACTYECYVVLSWKWKLTLMATRFQNGLNPHRRPSALSCTACIFCCRLGGGNNDCFVGFPSRPSLGDSMSNENEKCCSTFFYAALLLVANPNKRAANSNLQVPYLQCSDDRWLVPQRHTIYADHLCWPLCALSCTFNVFC